MSEITIKSGDTYYDLARTYNTSIKAIQDANPGVNPKRLQIGQKLVIPDPAPVQQNTGLDTVTITNAVPVSVPIQQSTAAANPKEKAFLDIIDRNLNIPNYKSSIYEKDGVKFLRLSRPSSDPYQPEKRHSIDLDSIKENLLINDGIIQQYNNMVIVTNSGCWDDDNTIDPGQSLDIPLSAIGQRKTFMGLIETSKNEELKKAVSDYLN